MKFHSHMIPWILVSAPFVFAGPTPEEKYSALHSHFINKTVDPAFYVGLSIVVILLLVLILVQRYQSVKVLEKHRHEQEKQNQELKSQIEEMDQRQRELLERHSERQKKRK